MGKLFHSESTMSAVDNARQTIEVGMNDDGVPTVKFALARGKGTGSQEIPVAEFAAFIEALSGYAEGGLNRTQKQLSPVDTLHATITLTEEERISFRVSSGKGAKPTSLLPAEIGGVVAFLREVTPMIERAVKKVK